jgi:uncharacterized DUF497 family protein
MQTADFDPSEVDAFEWDEAKRLANIERHGIDFRDIGRFFASPTLISRSDRTSEIRWVAIGILNERVIVSSSRKGIAAAASSRRRARRKERVAYRKLHPGGA